MKSCGETDDTKSREPKQREGRKEGQKQKRQERKKKLPSLPRLSLFRLVLCLSSSSNLWEETKDRGPPQQICRPRGALLKREVKSKIYSLKKKISICKKFTHENKKNSESRFRLSSEPRVASEKVPCNSQFLTERNRRIQELAEILTNHLREEVSQPPWQPIGTPACSYESSSSSPPATS